MAGKPDSTGGTTPSKGEAARAMPEVGGVHSSDDPVLDLWFGENMEERRDATCSVGPKRSAGWLAQVPAPACPVRRRLGGDGRQKLTTPEKVRKPLGRLGALSLSKRLQITLYRKAQSKPEYRFWSLYGEVQRADVLETAWRRVKANGGAAGVDGVTIESIAVDPEVEAAWLRRRREELQRKTYRPAEEAEGTREAVGRASRRCAARTFPRRAEGSASWAFPR
jgi:RNA-directed DNA polymerase